MLALMFLTACGGDAPWAVVASEAGAPVELPRQLFAYMADETGSDDGSAEAFILLSETELACADVLEAPLQDPSESVLYQMRGLGFQIAFVEAPENPEPLYWEAVYWYGRAEGPEGTRSLGSVASDAGTAYLLAGGWLELTKHTAQDAEGSFAVPWYSGSFAATHCGVYSASADTGDTGGGA